MSKRPINLPELPTAQVCTLPPGMVVRAYGLADLEAYARAAVEADRTGIATVLLEIYKAVGGDSECTPNPTPEEVLSCVRDLRECYNDALTWVPKDRIVVTYADEDAAMAAWGQAEHLDQGLRQALESFARRIRGDSDVPSEPAVAGERLKER